MWLCRIFVLGDLFVVTICVVTVCPVKKTPNLIVVVTNRYGDMDECQLVLWHMVP